MPHALRRASFDITLVCLAVTLLLGAALRLRNLTSSPGWFRDEGVYMEVAWNAAHGEARLGPINHTWVSPFQTIPPLYPLASGAWMRTIGALRGDERPNIQPFRWFSVGCGLLVIAGAYGLGLALGSPLLGLLAAALLAFDPLTVMFHRMGLPYNLLAVEVVATLGLAHLYFREPRLTRLLAPTLVAAMAPLTIYYGVALPLALILGVALMGRLRDVWLASLSILPLALFLCGLWWVHPLGLEADWAQFRADSSGTWSLADWTQDFRDLFATTPLITLGLVGLLMLRRGGVSLVTQLTALIYLFLWLRRSHNNIW
ncbi:glycosyltransferase family 39 protein, partial [Candidatus Sumerlaeota bacterium]|nr:glycosyltransferase family 39 protein [Candidatus Sumerlaeota bacterium]